MEKTCYVNKISYYIVGKKNSYNKLNVFKHK